MNEFSTEEINQLHDSFPPFHYSHLSVILPTPRNEFRRHGGGGLLLVLLAKMRSGTYADFREGPPTLVNIVGVGD